MNKPFEVALCGYYGFGNLGDELLLSSMISLIEGRGIERSKIIVLSGDPDATSKDHSIKAINRWSPVEVIRALKKSRRLILGGGGLFQDSSSIRTPVYYGSVVYIARLFGCSVSIFGNSLGPLRSFVGRVLTSHALRLSKFVCVRDLHSLSLAEAMGCKADLCPDPVLLLPMTDRVEADIVFVNLRPWDGDLEVRVAEKVGAYLKKNGVRAWGVAMCQADLEIMNNLKKSGVLPFEKVLHLTQSDLSIWRRCRWAVGMRLHFNVISALSKVPSISIPYDPKVSDFAKSVGFALWDGKGNMPKPNYDDQEYIKNSSSVLNREFDKCLQ